MISDSAAAAHTEFVRKFLSNPRSSVPLDDLEGRLLLEPVLLLLAREQRGLEHPEAHVEADADQQDAGDERDAPGPRLERIAGQVADQRDRAGREQQADRDADLRPARDEIRAASGCPTPSRA